MASKPTLDPDVEAAVAKAMSELMSARSWGASTFVQMPLFYPNGTQIVVKVEPGPLGFRVSDGGLTYREFEQIGAQSLFKRNAEAFAEEIGASVAKRAISLDVGLDELSAAMADVAEATARMSHKVIEREVNRGQAEIAEHLYERLDLIFGSDHVEHGAKLSAPSTREWDVDALVTFGGKAAVFHAVPKHHGSVYQTSAMFHDLALKSNPPVTTAVVHSKAEMGSFYNILAQAGNVIEQDDSSEVYKRSAVGWR